MCVSASALHTSCEIFLGLLLNTIRGVRAYRPHVLMKFGFKLVANPVRDKLQSIAFVTEYCRVKTPMIVQSPNESKALKTSFECSNTPQ